MDRNELCLQTCWVSRTKQTRIQDKLLHFFFRTAKTLLKSLQTSIIMSAWCSSVDTPEYIILNPLPNRRMCGFMVTVSATFDSLSIRTYCKQRLLSANPSCPYRMSVPTTNFYLKQKIKGKRGLFHSNKAWYIQHLQNTNKNKTTEPSYGQGGEQNGVNIGFTSPFSKWTLHYSYW